MANHCSLELCKCCGNMGVLVGGYCEDCIEQCTCGLTEVAQELHAALLDLLACHADGGFIEPHVDVLEAAYAACAKFKPNPQQRVEKMVEEYLEPKGEKP